MASSRYIIGVDLGTTNTAVAFVDTRSAEQRVQVFPVPQLVAPGELDQRRQLPSFVYMAGEHDLGPAETALPWDPERRRVVGELARSQGARMPSRMVASSKSWLCHGGVDRHAAVLPWGIEEGPKMSPVEASSLVLSHLAEAWDHVHAGDPDARFADQEVIVTVPASFDEAARELTLEAAERAGAGVVVLLEEPQAAFYAWIDSHPGRHLRGGDRVLVFDIGGGTTDFTLIAVGEDGDSFERTAVGDHLLLGGDNIDLTLAKQIESRLAGKAKGKKLDSLQWHGLVHACRMAKETLLSDESVDRVPITVAGRSSKLIGGTLKDELGRAEIEETISGGFFPFAEQGADPRRARGGLQEFGLPYAADPAVTRHLASFLGRHGAGRIDAVLFNGGAMAPASLRRRVLEQIERWQPEAGSPRELTNAMPELAVATGAAHYGLVRRGFGARISGGTPRAFYVGVGAVAGAERAVCLAPKGLEEGSTVELDRDFVLVTNRPVSFKLYSSTTRDDQPGALVPIGDGLADMSADDSDLLELPPIVTVLRARGRGEVTVHLQIHITELGALELWCREPDGARPGDPSAGWKLSFDMRAGGAATTGDGDGEPELDPRVPAARQRLKDRFTGPPTELPRIIKELEEVLEAPRDDWSTSTSRALFDTLVDVEEERRRTPRHEARWLNLAGFCLRPGFGAPLDEWRTKQMWRIFNEDLLHQKDEQCRLAWWIAWRRIAGGLSKGQQEQFYDRLAQLFLPGVRGKKKWYQMKPSKQESVEMLRCLANMERFSADQKITLGDELLDRLATRKGREDSLNFWALGRLGARVPLYGPLNCVVPVSKVAAWLDTVIALDWPDPQTIAFPMAQLGRRTGDRSRDIDDDLRARLATRLRSIDGAERTATLVEQIVALEAREERVALGDSLPPGLRLAGTELPLSTSENQDLQ